MNPVTNPVCTGCGQQRKQGVTQKGENAGRAYIACPNKPSCQGNFHFLDGGPSLKPTQQYGSQQQSQRSPPRDASPKRSLPVQNGNSSEVLSRQLENLHTSVATLGARMEAGLAELRALVTGNLNAPSNAPAVPSDRTPFGVPRFGAQ